MVILITMMLMMTQLMTVMLMDTKTTVNRSNSRSFRANGCRFNHVYAESFQLKVNID